MIPAPEQLSAVETILSNAVEPVLLTGRAGSGKSTVIGLLREAADVTLCATTGKAAVNIGGTTFDRLFCYDRETGKTRVGSNPRFNMTACAEIVVIDEASMMDDRMCNYALQMSVQFDKKLVLVGDFAQARPVKGEWPFKTRLFGELRPIILRECHRQSDRPFLDALDQLRRGRKTCPEYEALSKVLVDREPADLTVVRLYATNGAADKFNYFRLREIPLPGVRFVATAEKFGKFDWNKGEEDRVLEAANVLNNQELKETARVMITQNARVDPSLRGAVDEMLPYVNGDVGTVQNIGVSYDGVPLSVTVKLDRNGEDMLILPTCRETTDASGKPATRVTGFPLTLAYACTIHKAQGASLSRVHVDLASVRSFPVGGRHGLAYVGVSRARSLDGLTISGWGEDVIEIDKEAEPWVL